MRSAVSTCGGRQAAASRLEPQTFYDRGRSASENDYQLKLYRLGSRFVKVVAYKDEFGRRRGGSRKATDREEQDPRTRKIAERRAYSKVIDRCLAINADRMWTLTYRENMDDRERGAADLARFVRLMKKHLGEFHYVAVGELQKRGAWHYHIATNAYVRVEIIRALWLKACGVSGNIDVAYFGKSGSAIVGAYIGKYIMKDADEMTAFGRHRYKSSKGVPISKEDFNMPTHARGNGFLVRRFVVEEVGAKPSDYWESKDGHVIVMYGDTDLDSEPDT